jgi:hypothetical protein
MAKAISRTAPHFRDPPSRLRNLVMSRRSFLLTLGILGLLVGGVLLVLAVLTLHEPERYARAGVPPGTERQRLSDDFYRAFCGMINDVNGADTWFARFTEEQVNSYFDEGFIQSGLNKRVLPDRLSAPRVGFDADQVRVAFRYGCGFWSTIVSIDFRVWVTKTPNVVCLELLGSHAGALPINAQSLLKRLADELIRQGSLQVSWYRHDGHPVALLSFQADQPRTTLQLTEIKVEAGGIAIRGKGGDAAFVRTAMLTPAVD